MSDLIKIRRGTKAQLATYTPADGEMVYATDINRLSIGSGSLVGGRGIGREVLTADRTYYVATTGSDLNDGLTVGNPFLTIQKGINAASAIDGATYNVTVQVAAGTWTLTASLNPKPTVGSGTYTLRGDPTTPANVLLTRSTVGHVVEDTCPSPWVLDGFKLTNTAASSSDLIRCFNAAVLYVRNVELGATSRYQIQVNTGALAFIDGPITISGSAYCFASAQATGMLQFANTPVVTLTGTPAFSYSFVYATTGGFCYLVATYSGAATGKRYDVGLNAVVSIAGGGATYLPGNVTGTTATGGQYV